MSDTQTVQAGENAAFDAASRSGIIAWVRANLDGEVTAITRLERWRPQWKVDFTVDGESRAVLFRGNRPIAGANDLRFEMEVMQVLHANGIKVPRIYGWVDEPIAFVMDWVDTDDRAPGMLHTAIDNPTTMSDERWQAMLNYMTDLAAVHAVPVDQFAGVKRLSNPPAGEKQVALHATEFMYRLGSQMEKIDPVFEFLQQWLRRNVPAGRDKVSFIAGDAGQFMSAGTEVLALLDFEIANLGDTHWDLACFRGRHPYENMGDIPALYREYARVTGETVDLRAVGYHTVNFLQLSGIGAQFFREAWAQGANWIEGAMEYGSITRRAYEAIAELQSIPLDYDLRLPEPVDKPWEVSGLEKLMADITRLPTSDAFEEWERDLLHAIPDFLLSYSRYRDWFERETRRDLEQVLNQSFEDLASADAAAMTAIAEGQGSDAEWVQALHKRALRFSMIVAGTNPDTGNPLFHRLDPILG